MSRCLDWPGLMQAGLKGLGLLPADFWRLSPLELRIMLGAETLAPALTRARLDELARAFPDVKQEGPAHGADRNAGRPDRGAGGDADGHGRGGDRL
ncbi:rcc01693 family protein [Gemmobacter caeruleus]|uniref:rcc01693 family protein n=1 Tax=Gemmobacter caeruleus TaxID=2595004 RepID=UPI0011ECD49D